MKRASGDDQFSEAEMEEQSRLVPLGNMASPADIADILVFLAVQIPPRNQYYALILLSFLYRLPRIARRLTGYKLDPADHAS